MAFVPQYFVQIGYMTRRRQLGIGVGGPAVWAPSVRSIGRHGAYAPVVDIGASYSLLSDRHLEPPDRAVPLLATDSSCQQVSWPAGRGGGAVRRARRLAPPAPLRYDVADTGSSLIDAGSEPDRSQMIHTSVGRFLIMKQFDRTILAQKAYGYMRVSTKRQEAEGSGLDNQAEAIRTHARQKGYTLVATYEDTCSGSDTGAMMERPGLAAAVEEARRSGAVILVTEMSRLSRNVSRYKDFKHACTVPIESLVASETASARAALEAVRCAEGERQRMARATKDELRSRKLKGKTLGYPATLPLARRNSHISQKVRSDDIARDIRDFLVLNPAWRNWTVQERIERLNAARIRTSRGQLWTVGALKKPWRMALADLELQNEPDPTSMIVPASEVPPLNTTARQETSETTGTSAATGIGADVHDCAEGAGSSRDAKMPLPAARKTKQPGAHTTDRDTSSQGVAPRVASSPSKSLTHVLRSVAVRVIRSAARLLRLDR